MSAKSEDDNRQKRKNIDLNLSLMPEENYLIDLGFGNSVQPPNPNFEKIMGSGGLDYGILDLNLSLGMGESSSVQIHEEENIEIDSRFGLDRDLGFRGYNLIQIDGNETSLNLEGEGKTVVREESAVEREEALLRERERMLRQRKIAKRAAPLLAHPMEQPQKVMKGPQFEAIEEDLNGSQSPFSLAMLEIEKRNVSQNVRNKASVGLLESLFKWVPVNKDRCTDFGRSAPKLMNLCLNVLAKNADAIVSLECVPEELRHRLSKLVCDYRKMDAHFVELLARGSPTEIRVRDMSLLTEEEFTKIFQHCETKDLTVLQIDHCGNCMPDDVLGNTLAKSLASLPSLATISLRGAHRLSDKGLAAVAKSAPSLQSINLSHCSLVTSSGIIYLARQLEHTLRELYIDDCQNIDAMLILPALKNVEHLEVLSVAGIQTVTDDFVARMAVARGNNMKELVFANCLELTDTSLKMVGKNCPKLQALDLSYLSKLTDSSLQFLANGCRSICTLKLCHNGFSDEAIAAYLEASGGSLNILSLNNINSVSLNTALAIAKSSRKLLCLDLSWCRKLTEDALGLIVDRCLSLKLLKLFGCTQISDLFLNGLSNSEVQIIGCKMSSVLECINVLDLQETPLRYSPLAPFSYQKNLDLPDT